jgi:hypothetical protein
MVALEISLLPQWYLCNFVLEYHEMYSVHWTMTAWAMLLHGHAHCTSVQIQRRLVEVTRQGRGDKVDLVTL